MFKRDQYLGMITASVRAMGSFSLEDFDNGLAFYGYKNKINMARSMPTLL